MKGREKGKRVLVVLWGLVVFGLFEYFCLVLVSLFVFICCFSCFTFCLKYASHKIRKSLLGEAHHAQRYVGLND